MFNPAYGSCFTASPPPLQQLQLPQVTSPRCLYVSDELPRVIYINPPRQIPSRLYIPYTISRADRHDNTEGSPDPRTLYPGASPKSLYLTKAVFLDMLLAGDQMCAWRDSTHAISLGLKITHDR